MEHLFKNKKIWLSTFIPIIFSLVVLYLFLPAFNSIEDNLDEINVVMVNSDQDIGTEIVNELEKNSPFTVIEAKSMDEAMKQLEDKTAHMAIEIPESFTEQIQKGEPEITFIIDQARQSTIKSTMEEAVSELTKLLNENVYEMKKGKITAGIEEFYTHIEEISPENKPLMQSKEIIRGALNGLSYQNVQSNIIRLNENNHPLNMVFPLLIFLTLFISALIRSFAYDQEVAKAQSPHWHIFWHKQLTNLVAAFLYPIAILIIIYSFNIEIKASYVTFWLFLSVAFYMFSLFIQVFIDLFSMKGVGILIFLLVFQILTSGIVLPIELVTKYYTWASPFLPATYFTKGVYTILFTDTPVGNSLFMLSIFGTISVTISLIYIIIAAKNKQVAN